MFFPKTQEKKKEMINAQDENPTKILHAICGFFPVHLQSSLDSVFSSCSYFFFN